MDWYPNKFFNDEHKSERPYALLLLNQPLNVRAYEQLLRRASWIVCVDGGANQLYQMVQENEHLGHRAPDAIVGDLDSLRDDVHDYFKNLGGVEIVRVSEQDSTDFTKALRWLRKKSKADLDDRVDVLALGGLGGRVDQGFSVIHHLFKAMDDTELVNGDIYLLSEQSLSFVLKKGRNLLHGLAPYPDSSFRESIGIVPIRGPATISTKGLEWDVENWRTEMGGQISTSNHVKAEMVEVDVSDPMLFTIELADYFCSR